MDEYRDVARKVITLETRQNESQELALKHHLFMKAEAKEQELAKLKEQLKKWTSSVLFIRTRLMRKTEYYSVS